MPPKALAPMKTGSSPMRPVRDSGKAGAAKAIKCTSLSLPSGGGGSWSMGESIATVSVRKTMKVKDMLSYLRIPQRLSAQGASLPIKLDIPGQL